MKGQGKVEVKGLKDVKVYLLKGYGMQKTGGNELTIT